jgi:hypothetical protein
LGSQKLSQGRPCQEVGEELAAIVRSSFFHGIVSIGGDVVPEQVKSGQRGNEGKP